MRIIDNYCVVIYRAPYLIQRIKIIAAFYFYELWKKNIKISEKRFANKKFHKYLKFD